MLFDIQLYKCGLSQRGKDGRMSYYSFLLHALSNLD